MTRLSLGELRPTSSQWQEMGWVAGGQLAVLALSVVSIKLTTSIGPSEYGRFVLASSISAVLALVFFGPLEQGYVRFHFVHGTDPGSRSVYGRSLLRILGLSAAALALLAGIAAAALRPLAGLSAAFTLSAAAMIIAGVIGAPITGMLNALRRRRANALIQVAERAAIIALLLLLLRTLPRGAPAVMLALALAYLASAAARWRLYAGTLASPVAGAAPGAPEEAARRRQRIHRDVLGYSLPFLLWGGVSWLQSNGERWVIGGWMSAADVGRYGLAASLVQSSAGTGATILGQLVTPVIFGHFSAGDERSVRRGGSILQLYTLATLALFGAVALLLLAVGTPLVTLLSNRSFVSGGPLLCVLTVGMGLFYVAQARTTLGLALNRPAVYVAPKIAAALAAILLYMAGCRLAGVLGVAWAIVAANAFYLALVLLANRRLQRGA